MITYGNIILFSWAAFILVWVVLSYNVKRDIRGGFGGIWTQYWLLRVGVTILIIVAVARSLTGTAHFPGGPAVFLARTIFSVPAPLGWGAAALTVIGVAIAIWARASLGRNWSPRPAVKEHHELVTSGPYVFVRHPIYTGIGLMALGTAITGSMFGVGIFILTLLIFLRRISKEEGIMLELFPREYPEYQKRTKRLVPFVW